VKYVLKRALSSTFVWPSSALSLCISHISFSMSYLSVLCWYLWCPGVCLELSGFSTLYSCFFFLIWIIQPSWIQSVVLSKHVKIICKKYCIVCSDGLLEKLKCFLATAVFILTRLLSAGWNNWKWSYSNIRVFSNILLFNIVNKYEQTQNIEIDHLQ